MNKFKAIVFIFSLVFSNIISAQTCLTSITETTPISRYTDNDDGTVTDNITLLMWKRCPEGMIFSNNGSPDTLTDDTCSGDPTTMGFTWQESLQHIETLNNSAGYAGRNDWRLPSIKELTSIVELSCHNPAINLTIFPNTPTTVNSFVDRYWSSSIEISLSSYYRAVDFDTGEDAWYAKLNGSYVRLVRSN